jgi:hypothetical protein
VLLDHQPGGCRRAPAEQREEGSSQAAACPQSTFNPGRSGGTAGNRMTLRRISRSGAERRSEQ